MRELPEKYGVDGMELNLLCRKGEFALVSTTSQEGRHPSGYEVHKIRIRPTGSAKINGTVIKFDASEGYQSASNFGHKAWWYPTLDEVYKDFPIFKEGDNNGKDVLA